MIDLQHKLFDVKIAISVPRDSLVPSNEGGDGCTCSSGEAEEGENAYISWISSEDSG